MKILITYTVIAVFLSSCDVKPNKSINKDTLPKTQSSFMKKLYDINHDYSLLQNPIKQDKLSEELVKFALDSLKNVKEWVLIVDNINDISSNSDISEPSPSEDINNIQLKQSSKFKIKSKKIKEITP